MGTKENNIINMSMEIANKLGHSIYQEGYYHDECIDS